MVTRAIEECEAGPCDPNSILILIRFQDETNYDKVMSWQDHFGLI